MPITHTGLLFGPPCKCDLW